MANLSGKKVKDTYQGLIKTVDNEAADAANRELTDGAGNDLNISVNTGGDLTAVRLIKSSGTSSQFLMADGSVLTLTNEGSGISSNDTDANIPTNAAVKDYVDDEISDLLGGAPTALDTLNELAAAINDDSSFSTTITTALAKRLAVNSSQSFTEGEITQALTNLGITATKVELNYTDGVTSNIQTQLNSKQATITGAATTIDDSNLTASKAMVSDGSGKVAVSTVTAAELGYVSGVNSSIQTQINNITSGSTSSVLNLDVTVTSNNKFAIDGQEQTDITLLPNTTYRFNQTDSSNAGHPLKLSSTSDGTHNSGTAWTTNENVSYVGTAGSVGAYTQIGTKHSTDIKFYYYCVNHSNMGGAAYSRYQTYEVSAVDSGDDAIIRLTGNDSSTDDVKLVAGSNITITPSGDDITIASTASGGGGGGGVSWQSSLKTADFTAVANEGYFVNVSSSSIRVTMPSTPSVGDTVSLIDAKGAASTNNIIVSSSNKINGSSSNSTINYDYAAVNLVYSGTADGWVATSAANETDEALAQVPINVDYLVVAGGGGGGRQIAGGGGAGGVRTSYNDGTSNTTSSTNLPSGKTAVAVLPLNGNNTDAAGIITSVDSNIDYVTGKYGQGAEFNGASSKITTDYKPPIGSNSFSISCWVKLNGYTTTNQGIWATNTSTGADRQGLTLQMLGDKRLRVAAWDSAGGDAIYVNANAFGGSSNSFPTGQFFHLVVTYSNGLIKIYVDGSLQTDTMNQVITAHYGNLTMGVSQTNVDDSWLDGVIDQFRVYESLLDATDVSNLYDNEFELTSGGDQELESTLSLQSATNYTVTVGGGGAGGSDLGSNRKGTVGVNSTFSTITSTGGGYGGGGTNGSGGSGGSGGGGSIGGGAGSRVTSPAIQGFAGGTASGATSNYIQAGGGGASEVGQNAASASGGNGGDGLISTIISSTNATSASIGEVSGSDVYFGGGGGGGGRSNIASYAGSGGLGGGTDATYTNTSPSNADDNTGGGGGASGYNQVTFTSVNGASGGSGVVVLRYSSSNSINVGSGIIEASGSPFTEGSDKISVFTGGTGTISFN